MSAPTASFIVCGTKFEVDAKYKLTRPIGTGAYGVVCAGVNSRTDEKVAIKKISKAFANLNQTKRTLREAKLLRHFRHENILHLVDILAPRSFDEFEDCYLVTELLDTDLHQIIVSSQTLSDEHIQYFVYQVLRGLKYIHSAHVIHRDLKPSNLLVNSNCELKICDFGLARVALPEKHNKSYLTEYVATRWYRAPEVLLSWKEYTKAIDMWSVGCIFAELLGRKPFFPGRDYMHQLHLVLDTLGTPSFEDTESIASPKAKEYIRSLPPKPKTPLRHFFPSASPPALDLLERMLAFAPEKRITVDEALAHPYLRQLHDPSDEPVATEAFDFGFEEYPLDKDVLKVLLWNECAFFHAHLPRLPVPLPLAGRPPLPESKAPAAPAGPPGPDPRAMGEQQGRQGAGSFMVDATPDPERPDLLGLKSPEDTNMG